MKYYHLWGPYGKLPPLEGLMEYYHLWGPYGILPPLRALWNITTCEGLMEDNHLWGPYGILPPLRVLWKITTFEGLMEYWLTCKISFLFKYIHNKQTNNTVKFQLDGSNYQVLSFSRKFRPYLARKPWLDWDIFIVNGLPIIYVIFIGWIYDHIFFFSFF